MIQNLVYNLCESLVENIDGVSGIDKKIPPTPITYLTQWKIVGNSEVHGVGNLTSWKVSGNSVVDNNTILSCGDLGQDDKYHVKISNGVTIYDIPLDAPLRKINNMADTIEFPSGTEGKALVTRHFYQVNAIRLKWTYSTYSESYINFNNKIFAVTDVLYVPNLIVTGFDTVSYNDIKASDFHATTRTSNNETYIFLHSNTFTNKTEFENYIHDKIIIYQLATPITELVDVSSFSVSPTDTYTSANVVPYSEFEYKKNVEIWSCGEYNPIDGKYHILVQPLGGSIVDIALDEPLRKVNDVADSIEYVDGVTTVTRVLKSRILTSSMFTISNSKKYAIYVQEDAKAGTYSRSGNILIAGLTKYSLSYLDTHYIDENIMGTSLTGSKQILITDPLFVKDGLKTQAFIDFINGRELIYELATPTIELVDAPQIEEAESYSMVISQGGKAVSWSSFETE